MPFGITPPNPNFAGVGYADEFGNRGHVTVDLPQQVIRQRTITTPSEPPARIRKGGLIYASVDELVKNLWIINANNPQDKLELQFVPLPLEVISTSNIASIPSAGRNNPFYHYTGGEDKLEFELDWHGVEESRTDVIQKCRWIQSFQRNNGYQGPIQPIILKWGDSDLFKGMRWLVAEASYKLSHYDGVYGMLPRQAYQKITLLRVTNHNTTRQEIRRIPTKTIPL